MYKVLFGTNELVGVKVLGDIHVPFESEPIEGNNSTCKHSKNPSSDYRITLYATCPGRILYDMWWANKCAALTIVVLEDDKEKGEREVCRITYPDTNFEDTNENFGERISTAILRCSSTPKKEWPKK